MSWTNAAQAIASPPTRKPARAIACASVTARLPAYSAAFLAVPPGAWHRVSNAGVGPLTFFVVAAPPSEGDAELAG